jgi:hypothetical protein
MQRFLICNQTIDTKETADSDRSFRGTILWRFADDCCSSWTFRLNPIYESYFPPGPSRGLESWSIIGWWPRRAWPRRAWGAVAPLLVSWIPTPCQAAAAAFVPIGLGLFWWDPLLRWMMGPAGAGNVLIWPNFDAVELVGPWFSNEQSKSFLGNGIVYHFANRLLFLFVDAIVPAERNSAQQQMRDW